MSAWLARSLAEQGHYAAAQQHLADIMRHPHLSPITQVSALAVTGVLAARRGGGTGALDDALPIAVQTGESQRLVPVATARAEAAWIAGRTSDLAAEIDRAWPTAVAHPQPWDLGELCWWLHLAGDHRQIPDPWPGPSRSCWRVGTARPPVNGGTWAAPCGRPTRWLSPPRRGTRKSAWTFLTISAPQPCAMRCCRQASRIGNHLNWVPAWGEEVA